MSHPGSHASLVMRTVDGSRLLAGLRLVVWRLLALWTSLGRVDPAPRPKSDASFVQFEQIARDSRLLRPAIAFVDGWTRAAGTARTVAWGRNAFTLTRRMPLDVVVRLIGITLLTALATHAVFVFLMPERLRPGLPWTVAALLSAFAATMVAWSGPVARAWTTWKHR